MTTPAVSETSPPRLEVIPGVWLDARLAVFLAASRVLIVADLHWGYAHSHRVRGNLLPAWGDAEIARRLHGLLADYAPAEMIWLGDSLHTLDGREAAAAFLRTTSTSITIVSGNHDAKWNLVEKRPVLLRDGYYLHHGDQPREIPPGAIEMIGHHHPAFTWRDGAGTRLKLPALVVSARRIVLPAFSPWAAGAPWPSGAPEDRVYAIGAKRIFTVSPALPQKRPFTK
ncbi:MAG TPA: metallophosphoesterase [Opitutus sp.]|nr:metallophosphoesterase [Opitutus sp.]